MQDLDSDSTITLLSGLTDIKKVEIIDNFDRVLKDVKLPFLINQLRINEGCNFRVLTGKEEYVGYVLPIGNSYEIYSYEL